MWNFEGFIWGNLGNFGKFWGTFFWGTSENPGDFPKVPQNSPWTPPLNKGGGGGLGGTTYFFVFFVFFLFFFCFFVFSKFYFYLNKKNKKLFFTDFAEFIP